MVILKKKQRSCKIEVSCNKYVNLIQYIVNLLMPSNGTEPAGIEGLPLMDNVI